METVCVAVERGGGLGTVHKSPVRTLDHVYANGVYSNSSRRPDTGQSLHSLEIVETPVFTKLVLESLPSEQYRLLQWALVARPDQGALVPHASGLRKLRWTVPGQGKRGGLRVLYFWDKPRSRIYMLYLYSKRDQADLTSSQAKALGRLIREELK